MDTTKLIVEYLVIGILVVLSIAFLGFSISPQEFKPILDLINLNSSIVGTAAFIIILLPIAYGVGIVAEYLGMFLCEWRFNAVKEKRFSPFVRQNLKWLLKDWPFKDLVKKDQPIPDGTGVNSTGKCVFLYL